jgi:hypothetical protein
MNRDIGFGEEQMQVYIGLRILNAQYQEKMKLIVGGNNENLS